MAASGIGRGDQIAPIRVRPRPSCHLVTAARHRAPCQCLHLPALVPLLAARSPARSTNGHAIRSAFVFLFAAGSRPSRQRARSRLFRCNGRRGNGTSSRAETSATPNQRMRTRMNTEGAAQGVCAAGCAAADRSTTRRPLSAALCVSLRIQPLPHLLQRARPSAVLLCQRACPREPATSGSFNPSVTCAPATAAVLRRGCRPSVAPSTQCPRRCRRPLRHRPTMTSRTITMHSQMHMRSIR